MPKDKNYREIKALDKLKNYVALAVFQSSNYQKYVLMILDYFVNEKKIPGVYVSVNKPYVVIKKSFDKSKIKDDAIIFIDAITQLSGAEMEKTKKCIYLDNPESLTDFGISITEAITALELKEKFIFFDSVDTLLIYNKQEAVLKFMHFLIGRIRQWNVKGIIVTVEKTEMIPQLSEFCDKVIYLKK